MQICPNCHTSNADGVSFCASCGSQLTATRPAAPTAHSLHCPQCKSVQISPVVESNVNGALTTHSGSGRISATKVSNTHRNYWLCQNCGSKFRNIQNLEEEIVSKAKELKLHTIGAIIGAIISLYLLINLANNPWSAIFMGMFTLGAIIFTIVCFCYIFVTKNKIAKMKGELEYLKTNCFN